MEQGQAASTDEAYWKASVRQANKLIPLLVVWYAVSRAMCFLLVSAEAISRGTTAAAIFASSVLAVCLILILAYRAPDDLGWFTRAKEASGEFNFETMFKLSAQVLMLGVLFSAVYLVLLFVKTSLSELELMMLFSIPCVMALFLRRSITVVRSTILLYRAL